MHKVSDLNLFESDSSGKVRISARQVGLGDRQGVLEAHVELCEIVARELAVAVLELLANRHGEMPAEDMVDQESSSD